MAFDARVDCLACRVEGARVETWVNEPCERLGVPSMARCSLCGVCHEGRVALSGAVTTDGWPGCGSPLDDSSVAAHRCPFCGTAAEPIETIPAQVPATAQELRRALDEWASEESLGSAEELLEGYFVTTTPAEILAALGRGETIETTFDVVEYLFSSG